MNINRKTIFSYLVFVLPIIIILPIIFGFPRLLNSQFSDLEITHYPNALFIQESIQKYGQIPLWNPHFMNGYPFDGDPLSGLWYPPGWISILLPLPFGLNINILFHLLAGGLGMLMYLREKNFDLTFSLFGAGLFMIMPNLITHIGAGHVTLTYAICLSPWLLYAVTHNGIMKFRLVSIFIGLIVLADIRWLPYASTLLLIEICSHSIREKKDPLSEVKPLILPLGLGLLSASVLLIPMAMFTSHSTRVLMSANDVLAYSLPLMRLTGLIIPVVGGAEWTIYIGGVLASLSLGGIVLSFRRREYLPWSIGAVLLLIWSLGENIPGISLVAKLPGINLTRVPARGMIAVYITTIILSLIAFRTIIESGYSTISKTVKLSLFASFITLSGYTGFAIYSKNDWTQPAIASLVILLCFIGIILEKKETKLHIDVKTMIPILILSSLFIFDIRLLTVVNPNDIRVDSNVRAFLTNESRGKIFTPSYSISQAQVIQNRFSVVNGIAPIQLIDYVKFLENASGVQATEYSVIQPPLKNGEVETANSTAIMDLKLLAEMGVDTIISAFPIQSAYLNEVFRNKDLYIYRNEQFRALPSLEQIPPAIEEVKSLKLSPLTDIYQIESPDGGILQTGQVFYPGWSVTIDHEPGKIIEIDHFFRSVKVPPGNHIVEFVYRPIWTYIGGLISLLVFASLIFLPMRRVNG